MRADDEKFQQLNEFYKMKIKDSEAKVTRLCEALKNFKEAEPGQYVTVTKGMLRNQIAEENTARNCYVEFLNNLKDVSLPAENDVFEIEYRLQNRVLHIEKIQYTTGGKPSEHMVKVAIRTICNERNLDCNGATAHIYKNRRLEKVLKVSNVNRPPVIRGAYQI